MLTSAIAVSLAAIIAISGALIPAQASDIHDSPNSDVIAITQLKTMQVTDGTAPFDADDTAGNDSNDHNGIVRSFDTVSYDFQYSLAPDSPTDYYRQATVGFKFTLPYPETQVTFAPESMAWLEQPQVSRETIHGVKTQVLTGYRSLTASSSTPTVAPGTFSGNLVVNVRGAAHHFVFQPSVSVWAEPHTGAHQPATLTFPVTTASAKLSINTRAQQTVRRYGVQDFATGVATAPNRGLGKVLGYRTAVAVASEMRWQDRSKGLKGLEVPSGPVSFDVTAQVSYTSQDAGHTAHVPIVDLQPYLYDVNDVFARPNTSPQASNTDMPGFGDTTTDKNSRQGEVHVTNVRRDERGLHMTVTFDQYDTTTFPRTGASGYPSSKRRCVTSLMTADCSAFEVAVFHADWLSMVVPATVRGQSVSDYYGGAQTGTISLSVSNMRAQSVSGVLLPEVSDNSNQSVTSDDKVVDTFESNLRGEYYPLTLYANRVGRYTDFGYNVDWNARQSYNGSDVLVRSSQPAIGLSYKFKAASTADIPVASRYMVAIDDKRIQFDNSAFNPAAPYRLGGGFGSWGGNTGGGKGVRERSIVRFAVKPDGSGWRNWEEQTHTPSSDLVLYDTYQQAAQHGTVVAAVWDSAVTINDSTLDYDTTFGYGTTIPVKVSDTATPGEVAPYMIRTQMWTRGSVSQFAQLDPSAGFTQWDQWVRQLNVAELVKRNITPAHTTSGETYTPSQFDNIGTYLGGDTVNRSLGDSALIGWEIPQVAIQVAQQAGKQPKTVFDLDLGERTVDWQITATSQTNSTQETRQLTDYTITDTLPAGLTYIPGSAMLGGNYRERTPLAGEITEGIPIEPTSTHNEDGTTTLIWHINDAYANKPAIIHYSTSIGTAENPDTDVANNQQFAHTVSIQSKYYHVAPNTWLQQQANATMRVSKLLATQLTTRTQTPVNDVNQPITFISTLTNSARAPKDNVTALDVIPYATSDFSFHGSVQVGSVAVEAIRNVDIGQLQAFVTDEPAARTIRADRFAEQYGQITWKQVAIHNSELQLPTGMDITAVSFRIASLQPDALMKVTTTIQPSHNHGGDLYVQHWSDGDNIVQAAASTVNRSVAGTVWQDTNHDGVLQSGEPIIAGATVTLVDSHGQQVRGMNGQLLHAVTDSQGRYRITQIPAGEGFTLHIQLPERYRHSRLTVLHQANTGRDNDSDATDIHGAVTHIPLKAFPAISAMSGSQYVDTGENVGVLVEHETLPVAGSVVILVIIGTALLCIAAGAISLAYRRKR